MPDTRHIADSQPFARSDEDAEFDADAEAQPDRDAQKYFAVLALDGDEMGQWISGLHRDMPTLGDQLSDYPPDLPEDQRQGAREYFKQHGLTALLSRKRPLSPSFHLQFSEMLANFGNFCVRCIVEAFDGRLIYSGGDDVLALLPATSALACARALRAGFQGDPAVLMHVKGAWRVRRDAGSKDREVRLFDFNQAGFIQLDRNLRKNGFALEGEPVLFPAIVCGPAADCSVGIAIAHFKASLQDVVRAAQTAEKRAKKELGRRAVAVTLMKRSGEISEWGCQWESGGLVAYEAIVSALQAEAISGKFPHRVAELLHGYLTERSPLAAGSFEPLPDFPTIQVALREFRHATDRQGQNKNTDEYRKLVELAGDEPDEKLLLKIYLTKIKEDAESKLRKVRNDSKHWAQLAPEEKRRLEIGPIELPIRALIGLCQTVAFAHRTSRDDFSSGSSVPSVVPTFEAERQPTS